MDKLYVVQHCQSEHHVNGMTGGWTDTPLTDLGRRQAAQVALRLGRQLGASPAPQDDVEIISSDLMRASQTAGIVAESLCLPVRLAPGLRENCGGEATGKTREWANGHIDRSNWSLFDWTGFAGGETWRQFYQRVCQCMDELAAEAKPTSIIVTHGGTVSNIVAWWLRLPLDVLPERTPFAGTPGGISLLRKNQHGNPAVRYFNDTSHLEGLA